MRPKRFARDNSKDTEYLKHTISKLKTSENYEADIIVILRPTLPFRNYKIVDRAIKQFINTKADSLKSITIAKETPYKMWKIYNNKFIKCKMHPLKCEI